jgi:hypothetical protein
MFFKKSKHKIFAETIIAYPEKITEQNSFAKIWTKQEKLLFGFELSLLMFFLSAPKLKKDDMMILEKEIVSILTKTKPSLVGGSFSDIIRNRFQQYGSACRNAKENNYAEALETVFIAFYEIDRKRNMLEVIKEDCSEKLSITAATNRVVFAEALNKIYGIVDKQVKI